MKRLANPLFTRAARWAAISVAWLATWCPNVAVAEFTPIAGWDRHLFPAYIIATATMRATPEEKADAARDSVLGDVHGLLGVTIQSPSNDALAKVTITSDSILEPSVYTVTLPKQGVRYKVHPPIKYKYNALVRSKQTIPLTVTYRVELPNQPVEEQAVTLTLRSINDCPMSYDKDKTTNDVSFVFAAYVNEEHPQVDKLLREALNAGVVDSFHGYSDEKEPADVLRQAYALWHVLSKRGVRYSDSTTTVGDSEDVNSQHVRLIDESINNAQANCVDGSVLFASLLRKIGIEPFLVTVPGHCYVGFYLDEDGKQRIALETTLIGLKPDSDDDRAIEGFTGVVDEQWAKTDSWAAFVAAVQAGTEDMKKNSAKFESDKESDYQFIPIAEARRLGILPIPFTPGGKE
jgi:hypothetical protein